MLPVATSRILASCAALVLLAAGPAAAQEVVVIGDLNDAILFRTPRTGGLPVAMATASDESGPVVHTRDGAAGAAFVASEQQSGVDLNGDGDAPPNDLVVRWFVY